MSASLMMVLAALLFSTMGVCVKLATAELSSAEVVMYRGLIGLVTMAVLTRIRGQTLGTSVPWMHVTRGLTGVVSLMLWFYAISGLPIATAMTLNYMSPIWMTLFLVGGAVLLGRGSVDWRLVLAVFIGFGGVAAILQPTLERDQAGYGLAGLMSGVLAAMSVLQVAALGRLGEPEGRVVFYFSLGGTLVGGVIAMATTGLHVPRGWNLLWVMAVGLSATLAQLLMTRAYAIGRPLVNASLQYLGIVFAFCYGVWLFDDVVTPLAVMGMLLVVAAGLVAARLREAAKVARSPDTASEIDS